MVFPTYMEPRTRDHIHNYNAHNKKRKKTNKSRQRNHKRTFRIKK